MAKDNFSATEVGTMIEDFDEKLTLVIEHIQGVDHRLDRVENQFVGVENRLDRIENQLVGVDHRLDRIEIKLDTKTDKTDLQKIDRRVTTLEAT